MRQGRLAALCDVGKCMVFTIYRWEAEIKRNEDLKSQFYLSDKTEIWTQASWALFWYLSVLTQELVSQGVSTAAT